MRMVITGLVVSNGGDAAILDAQVDVLRRALPGLEMAVHDSAPPVARRLYPDLEVHPVLAAVTRPRRRRLRGLVPWLDRRRVLLAARAWRLSPGVAKALLREAEREVVRSLAEADVVAHTGGTTLVETYDLDPKLFELEVASAAGATLVLLPQSLGPFTNRDYMVRLRRLLSTAALVLLRDDRSAEHLTQVGISTQAVEVVPDIVFALAAPSAAGRLRSAEMPARPRVAVSVRDCEIFLRSGDKQRSYEDAVGALVVDLVRRREAAVTFVSTCQGTPEYWADDSAIALRIHQRLPEDVRGSTTVDRTRHDHSGLAAVFGEHDVAVTTRMHAGIIALGAGTPVLPIAYEFKTREVMGQVGLGDHVEDVGEVTDDALVAAFDALLEDLPALRGRLAVGVEALRARAHGLDTLLADRIGSTRG
ncbi:hypothetical protein HLB09_02070 [Pseudokineococcus marinus]|uniref:Polysaccharide pyruvyl transferase domain-containing protein n=2 Tax=Pseudokineococcus marinus TaxID=351215 RepID=A0A849BFP0_9ACTN|nr:hypothetical protein [Pseudokineococcus marinus]